MENIKEIKINCESNNYFELDSFNDLQGNLKSLSDENFDKLKKSIVERGFAFPYFAWRDSKKKLWILDAHQRTKVLKHLRDVENYIIPKLPTVLIKAQDKREAKELLLIANSRYGVITREGLQEFISEINYEIDLTYLNDILDFPDIDLDNGFNSEYNPNDFGENFELKDGDREPYQQMTFTLSDKQAEFIQNAIANIKQTDDYKYCETFGNENSNGNALYLLITKSK